MIKNTMDMGNRTDQIVKGGVSYTTVLVMIFAVLKFMGLTTMSWAWVLSPWWLPFIVGMVAFAFVVLIVIILDSK